MEKTSIFQKPGYVAFFALTAAMLWGWAYPLIKLGFVEWGISPDMTGSKMLFAGIRFCLSGLLILAVAKSRNMDFSIKGKGSWAYVLLFALLNTTLHYAFFYIGLSHSAGSRASILNSLGTFLLVILACIFFKSDKLTVRKLVGCAVGICGVLALNLDFGSSTTGTREEFSWMGDGMIILNALCSACAGLLTRGLGKRVHIFVGTGYSLAAGGLMLIIPGLIMGGSFSHVSFLGFIYLGMLIVISTVSFALYNKLILCNPVGKVAIYNSLIPAIGMLSSCLCLGEAFRVQYVIAAALAAAGIFIINKGKK